MLSAKIPINTFNVFLIFYSFRLKADAQPICAKDDSDKNIHENNEQYRSTTATHATSALIAKAPL